MPWYVLVTKPRSELKVRDRLAVLGVSVCCPVRVEKRQWSDRVKKVDVPLLPSMVLVCLAAKDHYSPITGGQGTSQIGKGASKDD